MKVTVCELNDEMDAFKSDWEHLSAHVRQEASQLVLLPEMPFFPWFARTLPFDPVRWALAVEAHESWLLRLPDLAPATILCTRPVERGRRRLNEGFSWDEAGGYQARHEKYYLPEDEGFWEASWYARGDGEFEPFEAGGAYIGFQICSELWFFDRSRQYGQRGVQIVAVPRCTQAVTVDKWLTGGRASAVVAGAYNLSSNHVSQGRGKDGLGGQGWIVSPDGEVLGVTSAQQPFLTIDLDLSLADAAKSTYPRYISD